MKVDTTSIPRFIGCALLAVIITAAGCTYAPYSPPPMAFSGRSSEAKKTLVVPTLDSPMPKGRNVIWCATFQLCWDELKPIVGKGNVPAAQSMVQRLDNSPVKADDLPEGIYYTAAGLVRDGIIDKIKAGMSRRFPRVTPTLPITDDDGMAAVAYAYLAGGVNFRNPYFDREGGDDFTDSAGNSTRVSSFGLYKYRESSVNTTLARQISVLYCGKEKYFEKEFVLDLDRNSQPTQLIIACLKPKETLAATWQDVQRKMLEWNPADGDRQFGESDSLAVPNINFKILHKFKELETSGLLKTMQSIEFRLDRSGAALASEAFIVMKASAGRNFSFTRPFLVVMRKRGASQPYFAMWIDNAELLCKQPTR